MVITTRWVHKDGHTIWVEHRNVVIYDNNGEILALEGIARDVISSQVYTTGLFLKQSLEDWM